MPEGLSKKKPGAIRDRASAGLRLSGHPKGLVLFFASRAFLGFQESRPHRPRKTQNHTRNFRTFSIPSDNKKGNLNKNKGLRISSDFFRDIPNPSIIGGEGIRTPGLFRVNGFQDRRLRPLGHSSKSGGASSRLAMSRQWAFFGFLQLSVDIAGRFGSLRPPFRRCTPHESTRLPPQDVCVFCPFVRV